MADAKISALNALTTADDADLFAVVDTSATETKKITKANMLSPIVISAPSVGRVGINTTPSVSFHVATPTTTGSATIGATETVYTANFRSTLLDYWPVDATGAQLGVSRANLGSVRFLNTTNAAIGTNGFAPLIFSTFNTERIRIGAAGLVGIGTSSPTNLLDVNADSIRVRTAQTPATAGAAGNQGEIAWDADYIYVCVATNTWKRVAIATW